MGIYNRVAMYNYDPEYIKTLKYIAEDIEIVRQLYHELNDKKEWGAFISKHVDKLSRNVTYYKTSFVVALFSNNHYKPQPKFLKYLQEILKIIQPDYVSRYDVESVKEQRCKKQTKL
jgi:hypothetical protein